MTGVMSPPFLICTPTAQPCAASTKETPKNPAELAALLGSCFVQVVATSTGAGALAVEDGAFATPPPELEPQPPRRSIAASPAKTTANATWTKLCRQGRSGYADVERCFISCPPWMRASGACGTCVLRSIGPRLLELTSRGSLLRSVAAQRPLLSTTRHRSSFYTAGRMAGLIRRRCHAPRGGGMSWLSGAIERALIAVRPAVWHPLIRPSVAPSAPMPPEGVGPVSYTHLTLPT